MVFYKLIKTKKLLKMTNSRLLTIKNNKFQSHPYHLVETSPWPLLISWTLFFMAIGAVLYMHGYINGGYLLTLGFVLTGAVMFFWLGDVNTEGSYLGNHSKEVKAGLMIGFILFVISEAFAFLSVFWAFFHSSIVPSVEIGGQWPPVGITAINPFAIPLLNTVILVSSGAFITFGHHALIAGKRKETILSIYLTIVLAVIFTMLQGYEYLESNFSFADSVFGNSFYASTGLHGFHVIVGTLFIIVSFVRIVFYNVTKQSHVGLETGILYWHFVDVVWLFLFIAVYYWGSGS